MRGCNALSALCLAPVYGAAFLEPYQSPKKYVPITSPVPRLTSASGSRVVMDNALNGPNLHQLYCVNYEDPSDCSETVSISLDSAKVDNALINCRETLNLIDAARKKILRYRDCFKESHVLSPLYKAKNLFLKLENDLNSAKRYEKYETQSERISGTLKNYEQKLGLDRLYGDPYEYSIRFSDMTKEAVEDELRTNLELFRSLTRYFDGRAIQGSRELIHRYGELVGLIALKEVEESIQFLFAPQGDWRESCEIDGLEDDTLFARCKDSSGEQIETTLNIKGCISAMNDEGHLKDSTY